MTVVIVTVIIRLIKFRLNRSNQFKNLTKPKINVLYEILEEILNSSEENCEDENVIKLFLH